MACIVGTEPDAVGNRYSSSNTPALLCRKATTCGCRVSVVDVHHMSPHFRLAVPHRVPLEKAQNNTQ